SPPPLSPLSHKPSAARAGRRRRAQASRRGLRLDRRATARAGCRSPRQPEAHAPREAADSGCHTLRMIRDVIVPTPRPEHLYLGRNRTFPLCVDTHCRPRAPLGGLPTLPPCDPIHRPTPYPIAPVRCTPP